MDSNKKLNTALRLLSGKFSGEKVKIAKTSTGGTIITKKTEDSSKVVHIDVSDNNRGTKDYNITFDKNDKNNKKDNKKDNNKK